jgi:hypothetical protein
MIIGYMTLLFIQFSLQYSFSILTTCSSASSLVVLDNASYHNVKTEDTVCPNFSQKKAVLQIYLTQHNIPFSATNTKKVLYEKIKQKKTPVVYKTDKISNLHGYEVLRTTVRHCELNPIELIWAQGKGFVAKNNTTFRLKDVKELRAGVN